MEAGTRDIPVDQPKVLLGFGNTNVISAKNESKLNVLVQMKMYPGGSKSVDSSNPLNNAVNISFYLKGFFFFLSILK